MTVIPLKAEATFEDFWKACPKKVGRAKTRELFERITAPGGTDTQSYVKDANQYMTLHLEATPDQLVDARCRNVNHSIMATCNSPGVGQRSVNAVEQYRGVHPLLFDIQNDQGIGIHPAALQLRGRHPVPCK